MKKNIKRTILEMLTGEEKKFLAHTLLTTEGVYSYRVINCNGKALEFYYYIIPNDKQSQSLLHSVFGKMCKAESTHVITMSYDFCFNAVLLVRATYVDFFERWARISSSLTKTYAI